MSIIERTNPLNLQYRVCLVTSASSPLGVIICKTLLKANALVLGIDEHPKDHSLNSGLGTHFQFMQGDIELEGLPIQILKTAELGFGTDRVDVLVNVVDRNETKAYQSLCREVGTVMKERGSGSIVNIFGNAVEDLDPLLAVFRELASSQHIGNTRLNVVVPQQTVGGSHHDSSRSTMSAYKDAKTHMKALMKTEKVTEALVSTVESKHAATVLYDIGNLALFLAGDMSSQVDRKQVYLDGSCQEL